MVSNCGCGCDSVDFAEYDSAHPPHPIAEAVGVTLDDQKVGIIVRGRTDAIIGLEVYAFGNEIGRLPVPDSIHPFFPD